MDYTQKIIGLGLVMLGVMLIASPLEASLIDGLVAWYPFNGDASDFTGNGHDGTLVGASPTTDRFGHQLGALRFDGNDYVRVPDHSDLTLNIGAFTLAAWANFDSYGADGGYYLMGHSTGGGNQNKWIFWLGNGGITFIHYPQPGSHWTGIGDYAFELDNWYHVAIRGSGNILEGFVNGNSIGTATFSGTMANPSNYLTIGSCELGTKPNRYFDGAIDDVRIYG